ncbi:MAG: ATP-binding protein [Bacteroidales bacterium]
MARRGIAFRYGAAVALTAAALLFGEALRSHLAGSPATPFFAAVALASRLGVGPGLLATALSAVSLDYFLIPPLYQLDFDADHIVRTIVFVFVSMIISGLSQSLRRETKVAEQRAEDADRELTERRRVESERAALLALEREARRQAQAAERRVAFLAEAGRQLAASLDLDAITATIGRLAVPMLGDVCAVYLVAADGSLKRPILAAIPPAEPDAERVQSQRPARRLSETSFGRRIMHGERILLAEIDDRTLDPLEAALEQPGFFSAFRPGSAMVVPLEVQRRALGAVVLLSTRETRRFGSDDLSLAEEVVGRAAAACANAQLYEQAQDANRMKDEFLATVSHELRTPLHAILGWTRLLRTNTLDAQAAERALETIERNAQAQAQLVADVLDVSRIVTGKLKLEMRPTALLSVVESALDAVRPSARAKEIEIEVNVEDAGVCVLGDAGRLQQAVWNLVANAIKFTPSGGHVRVDIGRSGNEATIVVEDTGMGIEAAFLPHVFDRFRQADSSTTRAHGGLGLGLSIVRHITELHGGRVAVHSDGPGAGSTFTVCLPLLPSTRPVRPAVAASRAAAARPATLGGLRVLAVDDHEDARLLVAASLERHGATVLTASSAHEALDVMARTDLHLLIVDIGMPESDGYDFIAQVRAKGVEHGGAVPAVALTAYARREDAARAIASGYQVHLAKPIDEEALVEAVAALAGRAQA